MRFLLPLVLILVMGSGVARGAGWMFRGSYYTYSPKRGDTGANRFALEVPVGIIYQYGYRHQYFHTRGSHEHRFEWYYYAQ